MNFLTNTARAGQDHQWLDQDAEPVDL